MDAVWQDIRYALRTLARSPGFTIVGVLVLALAIGVNTAIFSLVNALIFVKLPVPDAGELRFIYASDPSLPPRTVAPGLAYREFLALRERDAAMRDMLGYWTDVAKVHYGNDLVLTRGEAVTANYFSVLRIQPQAGRFFNDRDESPAETPSVIISDRLWRSRFNADPAIIGKTLGLDQNVFVGLYGTPRTYTIAGVAPPEFTGIANRFMPTEFWALHVHRALDRDRSSRETDRRPVVDPVGSQYIVPVLRKPAETTEGHVISVVKTAAAFVQRERLARYPHWTLQVERSKRNSLPFDPGGRIVPSRMAAALMLAAGAVVLIALANLTGLVTARGVTRRGEMAIRTTLGAGKWRLTRQLLTEGFVIAGIGGALGIIVAMGLIAGLVSNLPTVDGRTYGGVFAVKVPLDWRVLLFTAGSCLACGVLVGLAPVKQAASGDLLRGLAEGQLSATGRSRVRMRHLILIPQVCASLILLIVAGILIRGILLEELADRGYDQDKVVAVDFEKRWFKRAHYTDRAARAKEAQEEKALYDRVLARAMDVPGAESVALVAQTFQSVPLAAMGGAVVDRDSFAQTGTLHGTMQLGVTSEYFDVLRIPVIHGRTFDISDREQSGKVAVIDESLAWRLWGGVNPIGRHVAFYWTDARTPPAWMEVVGVVGNVARPLAEGAVSSVVYVPISQQSSFPGSAIVARAAGDEGQLIEALKAAIASADTRIKPTAARTMEAALDAVYFPRRVSAAILGTTGLAGLVLACIGLYGVVSYSVAQRVREIGIRTALGAERRDIMRMILRDGLKVIGLGTLLGGVLASAAIKLTSAKVVALPAADAVTLAMAPAILAAAMLLATYIPARRAAAVDPMIALRRL